MTAPGGTPRPTTGPARPPLLAPRARLVLGGSVVGVLLLWWATGSLLVALLVLVFLGLAAGLAVVVAGWARPRPEPLDAPTADRPTADLSLAPPAGAPVRRALRLALARPWVHGDGLLRATATRLDGPDALVWTPRGQQVAAPHLWVEWNPVDAAEIAGRRPLEALARELAEGYVERGREQGVRRLAERTWVHLLVSDDVPLGRVVVTAAFSEPQQPPVAAACASTAAPLAPARGAAHPSPQHPTPQHPAPPRPAALPAAPPRGRPAPPAPARPAASGRSWSAGALAAMATVSVPARLRTTIARLTPSPAPARAVLVVDEPAGSRLTDTDVAGRVELGRDPDGDVVVDHPSVSWRHLALEPDRSGGWTVTDLGSTNGTTVDGAPVTAPTPLPPGAELRLGADGPRLRLQVPERRPSPEPGATTTAPVVARGY
ncbi:FHA domain-containing protein [Actinomycetospora sp. TBRC 11914]|uniref:FHA domain-containing protein n=1 Tax=Actinomycetospora sp. TBRC 11914 TaxID=2729387 RepID=UPI00145E03BF|nr:FHA domain-containing protein [Actinomycetospora sp. TBRC 11914]NMO90576.1 FHA domain-containing protein [Actinomycetospora sp. TBRC 11914]